MKQLKMKQKFLTIMCVLAMVMLAFTACSKDNDDEPNNPKQPETLKTVKSVDVMYFFEVSEDMLRVADIEATWIEPDGTKDNAKLTNQKSQITLTYASFPAKANLSMKLTPKSPLPEDDEMLKLSADCFWYAYQVTYSDGTKYNVRSTNVTGSITLPGKNLTKYIDERLNPRLSDISYSITLADSDSGIDIIQLSK